MITLVLALAAVPFTSADVITDWNTTLLNAVRTGNTNPPRASRFMAMVHTSMFDAVNGIVGGYEPYRYNGPAPSPASPEAAAAAAAHRILTTAYPAQAATFDAALAASLASVPDGDAETNGVSWGVTCANAIIALRAGDHSDDVVPYFPPVLPGPGYWIPTLPAMAPALLPGWGLVTPWAMNSGDQFQCPAPPWMGTQAYADAFNEVKIFGRIDSTIRTPDQTHIALFWADGGGTWTPPGHWNSIANGIARQKGNTLIENARMFALLNIGVADASISSWDSKYAYNMWRPITAIRAAATDGDDKTVADLDWLPLIVTPPFPTYSSGHSTFSSTAAKVLGLFYGSDRMTFTTPSDPASAVPGTTRSFSSFSGAAAEAGQSRIYGGIHFQFDNTEAQTVGNQLGAWVVSHFLRILGDLDGDGHVSGVDLGIFLADWGSCQKGEACPADFNHDGAVAGLDLAILLGHWG